MTSSEIEIKKADGRITRWAGTILRTEKKNETLHITLRTISGHMFELLILPDDELIITEA